MARLPIAQANAGVAAMFVPGTTLFIAIFLSDPGTTGAQGELDVPRLPFAFTAPEDGTEASVGAPRWTDMPALTNNRLWFAMFTAAVGGDYLGGGQLTGVPDGGVPKGANLTAPVGGITAVLR